MARHFRRTFRLNRRSADDARSSVDEELDFHLQEAEAELVQAGWPEEEARREARRQFGDLERTRAFCREVQTRRGREERRGMAIDELWYDLRHATRVVLKSPGYAALVVATLAFGVAANTTIFSAMRPYLLRPLPYGAPSELVQVNQVSRTTGWDMDRFSWPQVLDWGERTRAFQALGAYSYGGGNLTGPEGPEQIQLSRVSAGLFGDVLRAEPFLGRSFLPEEGRPGADPVVLLGEALWRRRYAADPHVLGRTIALDGVQRTVVGVMPQAFVFPFGSARLWIPVTEDATADRGRMNLQIVARLRDGWTARRARADLTAIQSELVARYPDADGRMDGVTVKPLREALNFAWDVLSISFRILLGAVAVVLLIACLNVASLTLARGSGRRREVAVRAAMGAPRGRIVRQLLAESLVLALAGGALGVVLSYWVTGLIDPVLPEDLYRVGHIDIDGTVLLFSLAVTLVTPLVFGLWPALTASRTSLGEGLKESSRGSSGPASSRGRSALVIAQVANAVVLITGAGLMVRSLAAVREIDVGFEPDPILTAEVALPASDYPTAEERVAYLDRAVAALAARPGVASASAVAWIPLNHELMTLQVAPLEQAGTSRDEWPLSTSDEAWIGYFETMGVPLLEGRTFTAADGVDAEAVAIVSRTLARRLWPRESAVGRTFVAADEGGEPAHLRVVGIVGDVRHEDLSWSASGLQMYRPIAQAAGRRYFLLARSEGPPATLVAEARAALFGVDPNLPANVRPMTSVLREDLLQWSIGSVFMGAFGTGALLLATLGIYGLIAYSVAQRRREIGVRMALGATRGDVRRVVVRDGLRLTVFGLGIGLVLAVVLAHLAASTLYGVGPFDPVTLGAVAGLFLAVAGLASLIPAERASRTDPIHVMRAE